MLTDQQIKDGVINGSIPSSVWDMACTSHAVLVENPFIKKNCKFAKIFALAGGHPTPATTIDLLQRKI